MIEPAHYRNAMARLAGAVSIITTDGAAGRFGFTASAVCSVTDSPPTLLVCMNRQSRQHEAFKTNAVLCVNVLASAQQALSGIFANKDLSMPQRFDQAAWQSAFSGSPVLVNALANFDCRISHIHQVGTHSVLFCEVLHIANDAERDGLIYFDRGYHAVGRGMHTGSNAA